MTSVAGKKTSNRFTIQFRRTDPKHAQVVDLLNQRERFGKAQYIVDAVLHYEGCNVTTNSERPARFDEKAVEAVVRRILRGREDSSAGRQPGAASVNQSEPPPQSAEEINFDDAVEALGEDGINAVAGALDMFRKKMSDINQYCFFKGLDTTSYDT